MGATRLASGIKAKAQLASVLLVLEVSDLTRAFSPPLLNPKLELVLSVSLHFVLFFPRNEAAEKYPTRDASPPLELEFCGSVS